MEGQASISSEVLARYAADAAREVVGVRDLVASQLHRHRGVRVIAGDPAPTVELHLEVEWTSEIPDVGRTVQRRVGDYLERMAGARPEAVNVVVDAVGPVR
ncbi:MAG TPA: Asp23/Gls24 family envelope stress response protein [Gaiellaceae bacterium]|nr:Asp23/Gls24 family envelope stress response protein [Gaiellaceae bacterium]